MRPTAAGTDPFGVSRPSGEDGRLDVPRLAPNTRPRLPSPMEGGGGTPSSGLPDDAPAVPQQRRDPPLGAGHSCVVARSSRPRATHVFPAVVPPKQSADEGGTGCRGDQRDRRGRRPAQHHRRGSLPARRPQLTQRERRITAGLFGTSGAHGPHRRAARWAVGAPQYPGTGQSRLASSA